MQHPQFDPHQYAHQPSMGNMQYYHPPPASEHANLVNGSYVPHLQQQPHGGGYSAPIAPMQMNGGAYGMPDNQSIEMQNYQMQQQIQFMNQQLIYQAQLQQYQKNQQEIMSKQVHQVRNQPQPQTAGAEQGVVGGGETKKLTKNQKKKLLYKKLAQEANGFQECKQEKKTQNSSSSSGQQKVVQPLQAQQNKANYKHPKKEKIFVDAQSPLIQKIENDQNNHAISNLVKYLDLNKFKVEKCKNLSNGKQHNHKHCRYYHTLKDKRRILNYDCVNLQSSNDVIYTPDLCDNYETDLCKQKDKCHVSHNRVESVYHPEKYKSKYCTKYPKNLSQCEYGDYCSFAHSTKELKKRIIHQMTKDADFYMYYYKTEFCPFNNDHNKAQCVYSHNWQDFRRKPNVFGYDHKHLCQNWRAGTFIAQYADGCKDMASCKHSHGWKEQDYHPMVYKTQPCPDMKNWSPKSRKCERGAECTFYHSDQDKRTPFLIENSLPKRNDFQYGEITEEFIDLRNINHLQDFILFKAIQQNRNQANSKITHQTVRELIKMKVLKDITIYSMINGGMISKAIIFALENAQQLPLSLVQSSTLTFCPEKMHRFQSQANICTAAINFDSISRDDMSSSINECEQVDQIQPDADDIDEDTQSKISLFQQYFYQKFQHGSDFRIKKFSSQKFDTNLIQQVNIDMDSMVEKITEDHESPEIQPEENRINKPRENPLKKIKENEKEDKSPQQTSSDEFNQTAQVKQPFKKENCWDSSSKLNSFLENVSYERTSMNEIKTNHSPENSHLKMQVENQMTNTSIQFPAHSNVQYVNSNNLNQRENRFDRQNSAVLQQIQQQNIKQYQNIEFQSRQKLLNKQKSNISGAISGNHDLIKLCSFQKQNGTMQKGDLASVSISPELNTNTQLVEDDDFFYQH